MSQEVKVKLKSMKERKWNWMITDYWLFDSRNNKAQQFLAFCLRHTGWGKFSRMVRKLTKLQKKVKFKNIRITAILSNQILKQTWQQFRDTSQINIIHCVKSARIRSFSAPYFPAFGPEKLDTFHAAIFYQIKPCAAYFKIKFQGGEWQIPYRWESSSVKSDAFFSKWQKLFPAKIKADKKSVIKYLRDATM